ncbi:hypothetical protein C1H46_011887 [Malus baccata]|uniref:Iron hydrogenase large subunit C-terminal domain-containing protein n=1 Tax=Malus baccata TaxID=106549 RepID=A0A540MUL5_MALBA|nr:hypothetical protein C1H46_011887 [Malus baccata]
MLEKQSLDEFLLNLDKGKAVTVSLSPQSRASLAVYFGISPLQVSRKLTTFFKSLGVKAVFDTSCSRDLTLVEYCNEFIPRTADVYHVTVMPCYDKMLEASRDDFVFEVDQSENNENEGLRVTEVDSVLTSGEVLELIQLKGVDFKGLEESPLDNMQELLTNFNEGSLFGVHGSSGGYAETIFSYAAEVLFGREVKGPIDFKSVKNSDFQEVTLEASQVFFHLWNGMARRKEKAADTRGCSGLLIGRFFIFCSSTTA